MIFVKSKIFDLPCLSDKRGLSAGLGMLSRLTWLSCSFISVQLFASNRRRRNVYVFQPPQDTALISQCQHTQILHFDLNCKCLNTLALLHVQRSTMLRTASRARGWTATDCTQPSGCTLWNPACVNSWLSSFALFKCFRSYSGQKRLKIVKEKCLKS